MRPSSRFSYALRALVDLALHQSAGSVTVAAIAKRQGIPVRSLEQLLNRLRRGGLVEAERGPRGGYRLARRPVEIPVRAVFELLEPKSPKQGKRLDGVHDPARLLWQQVEAAVGSTLEATSIEKLASVARDQMAAPIRHPYTFHI